MPGRNGTGPLGQGPLTGRGAGYCGRAAGWQGSQPGYGQGYGRGFGRGRGFGMGRGWNDAGPVGWQASPETDNALQSIRNELQELKNSLAQLLSKKEAE